MTNYKAIEISTYIIFITGFLLWEDLFFNWQTFKVSQLLHLIFSILICMFIIIPFVVSHLKKVNKVIIKQKKSFKKRRQTSLGLLIFASLLILIITGSYLFLFGNRGGDIYGIVSNVLHFYVSFIFIILIVYHSYYLGRNGMKEDKEKLLKLLKKKDNQI